MSYFTAVLLSERALCNLYHCTVGSTVITAIGQCPELVNQDVHNKHYIGCKTKRKIKHLLTDPENLVDKKTETHKDDRENAFNHMGSALKTFLLVDKSRTPNEI